MAERFFESIFRNLQMPVIACRMQSDYPVVYASARARILFNPHMTTDHHETQQEDHIGHLDELLRFSMPEALDDLLTILRTAGSVERYYAEALDFERNPIPIMISANLADFQGNKYIILYIDENEHDGSPLQEDSSNTLNHVFQIAYQSAGIDDAINRTLRIAGSYVHVDRAYIFEEISPTMTRNTYEWCAPGVESAIEGLQNLSKNDHPYDSIVSGGVYVTNDIRDLPERDFQTLDVQGIKAVAIIPIFHRDQPIGYIGFDDCRAPRQWTGAEIDMLENIARVIASLIVRRKAEQEAQRTLEILKVITDNMEELIYVNEIDSYELVFVNRAMADSLGTTSEELIGQPCWRVLKAGLIAPCDDCQMHEMCDSHGNLLKEQNTWEFLNTVNQKWYMVKDSIINWVDGRKVHYKTATEITDRKRYEQKLQYFASTDTMTGAYNREWGYTLMSDLVGSPTYFGRSISLCFIDLDGLKITNDTHGHEAGDDMIVSIVEVIRASIRKSDHIFRWGGDEFILLLECDTATAQRIMDGIQQRLEAINRTGERLYKLSFSYGITPFETDGARSVDQIVADADQKMYHNKMQKR